MKPFEIVHFACALLLLPTAVTAQTMAPPRLARGDAAGSVAWLNGNKGHLQDEGSNDWYNHGAYGAATFGWYWTDHHKTEVEGGVTNSPSFYTYQQVVAGGTTSFHTVEYHFRTPRLTISERYQFGRNAWFHPHVGAGVELVWETTTEEHSPITIFDQQLRQSRVLVPARDVGPNTRLLARPYGEAGFKAYMTSRSFFRSDLRLVAHHGLTEVLFRFGFGADF